MPETPETRALQYTIRTYGAVRAENVARGLETPRLAALLTQKYAEGVIAAVELLNGHVPGGFVKVMDETVAALDPDWQQHQRERWSGRPADLNMR